MIKINKRRVILPPRTDGWGDFGHEYGKCQRGFGFVPGRQNDLKGKMKEPETARV